MRPLSAPLHICTFPSRFSLRHPDPVVLETGTNKGFSTIVLAQVLEDLKAETKLVTCDIDAEIVEKARGHVAKAGLMDRVDFRIGDSLEIIRALIADTKRLDFVFLDGCHETDHVVAEFKLVHKTVKRSNGTVYFDNTSRGDVAKALEKITRAYGSENVLIDPTGVASGTRRVLRGGSFINLPRHVRSAYRFVNLPFLRNDYNGFRLARTYSLSP